MAFLCFSVVSAGYSQTHIAPTSTIQTTGKTASAFHVDYAGLIGRSDIVLAQPPMLSNQAMPLGNGRLGVAVWDADGLTAQLNRVDTLPDRVPVARVHLRGLAGLTRQANYGGRLDLFNAEFRQQGGGMEATAFVDKAADVLVIAVTGVDPATEQTVTLHLDPPRRPSAQVAGATAILSERWTDDTQPGASGRNFGSLAAVTAEGRDVAAHVVDAQTVSLSFKSNGAGAFRVLIAAPHFNADAGAPAAVAKAALAKLAPSTQMTTEAHRAWWHRFWSRAGFMKITSADGAGEYMENLRALYLYDAAAESEGEYPGSQAGVADVLCSSAEHMWSPNAFWHWNLRMQVGANLSAGVPELNAPYFNLYRQNLSNMEVWTRAHMDGRPGICVPETMRFNGRGIEYENWGKDSPGIALNCDAGYQPYYNARTISTGAEVGLWIWQQYLATNDRTFLAQNFPVMAEAARFLLAYETPSKDGLHHTLTSNAHETQWDTTDPTTDLAARQALYTATIEAAKTLGAEPVLAAQLHTALDAIPALPRTEADKPVSLLTPAADAEGKDVIAVSYQPAAESHNVENIGLEPVWPYDLIGDTSPQFALAQRTFEHRPYPTNQDWSFDPIQAARLHYPDEVRATLIKLTETYQSFVNGFANWGGKTGEFYIEQQSVVAAALQEALVQDYDGTIRIDPAFPKEWDVDGQVAVRGRTRVAVQVRGGSVTQVTLNAGSTGPLKVRNPWPDAAVKVSTSGQPAKILHGEALEMVALAGHSYRLMPGDAVVREAEITGTPATSARRLGKVQIGLFPADK